MKEVPLIAPLKIQKPDYAGTINYGDLDDYVSKVYGVEFEVVADMEWSNNTSYSVWAEKGKNPRKSQNFNEFKAGKGIHHLPYILNDLADRDLIPPGWYRVKVSW